MPVRDEPAFAALIPDRGTGAATEEHFFRSPQYLEAEGTTHTLTITAGDRMLVAPLVVRPIPGEPDLADAISPYGYPGLALAGAAPDTVAGPLDPSAVDWGPAGLVSVFIRHQVGEPLLSGARPRNVLQIADPELERKSRMSDRQQIRKNERAGYELRLVPGPDSDPASRDGFVAAYTETMVRTQAAERYFFSREYFDLILSAPTTWLFEIRSPDGETAAASIATRSDGVLHYFLSGTSDRHLRGAPMKNLLSAMVDHSCEVGMPLNLGGGIVPGDKLEEFKRGFANRQQEWHTSELVCDKGAYERLTAMREPGGGESADPDFFPAYRAPG